MFLAPRPLSYSMIMSIALPGSSCPSTILIVWISPAHLEGFPGGSVVKNSPANARDMGSIPALGRSSRGRNGNPLLYSCQVNPMDRGTSWPTVYGISKSLTQRSDGARMHSPLNPAPKTIYLLVASSWYIFRMLYLTFATGIFGFHPRNWLFSLLASSKAHEIVWYLCNVALGNKSSWFILTLLVFVWITRCNLSFHIHTVLKEYLVFVLNLWCFPMLRTAMFLIVYLLAS